MAAVLLVSAVAGECWFDRLSAGVVLAPAGCCLPDGSCGSANMARCPKAQLNNPAVVDQAPAVPPVVTMAGVLAADCLPAPQSEIVPADAPDPHLLSTALRI